jgi:uncharacterized protein
MRQERIKSVLIACVSLFVVFSFVMPGQAADPDPKKLSAVLKSGGGAVGGVGYMVMTGMSKVVRDAYPRMEISVVPGGWVGNLPRVNSGELDIGSTTVAMCALAEAKRAPFDKPLPKVKAFYGTQDKLYYFAIVSKDTPVDSIGELFEKKPPIKLCTIQKGTTTELMWRNVFASQGVTWDDVAGWGGKMNFVAWGDGVNLVKDGHADGILAVGVRQIGWAMDLTHARDMKILKWEDEFLDDLKKEFGFGRDPIPANTYKGIAEDRVCPTDAGQIVVNADLSDEIVQAILAALADNADDYASHHKALVNFKAEGMARDMKLPLHPAAEAFYKSRNIELP